jgi:hypothetical protein
LRLVALGCLLAVAGCGARPTMEYAGSGAGGSAAGGGAGEAPGGAGGGGGPGGGGATPGGPAGGPGFGGSGTPVSCTFTVSQALSPAIPTVGIVTWSTTLAALTRAEIRFGLETSGPTMAAPVDLTQPDHRTLLLGMKGKRRYVFRIVATAGDVGCTSDDYPLETGAVPDEVPVPKVQLLNAAAHAPGFIVSSTGVTGDLAFIFDGDGDPVWWAAAPTGPSRANLSWDGTRMYILKLNVSNAEGELRRVSMDGMTVEEDLSGGATAHHDFTPIPGGIAMLLWTRSGMNAPCAVVERADDGALTTVVPDLGTLYSSADFHANAIHYYPGDDSYTVSDRNPNLFVKLTRRGQLVWQLGGKAPKDPEKYFSVRGDDWVVNHGHQLLPDGRFLFFTNGSVLAPVSEVREYQLDTAAMTATPTWSYRPSNLASPVLGDAQRLANGNTLVTISRTGVIHEVDPAGKVVMTLQVSQLGYAEHRPSLYGPPPR